MAEVYTAQEMREAADNFWVSGVISEVKDEDGRVVKQIKNDAIIAMLRQAADALEREERREKKYEYAAKYGNGFVSELHSTTVGGTEYAKENKGFVGVVRRQVGEWEEVAK